MSPKRCGRTRLAVIGANAIGLELGQAFGKLGSEVTFLDVAEQIASFEEPEIAAALAEVLTGDGARVLAPANVSRVTQAPDGTVMLEGDLGDAGTRLPVDRVLVATGRAPNTDLALDSAGVKVDVRGFVVVDEQLRSRPRRPRRGGWWCAAVADADTDQLLGVHMAGETPARSSRPASTPSWPGSPSARSPPRSTRT